MTTTFKVSYAIHLYEGGGDWRSREFATIEEARRFAHKIDRAYEFRRRPFDGDKATYDQFERWEKLRDAYHDFIIELHDSGIFESRATIHKVQWTEEVVT